MKKFFAFILVLVLAFTCSNALAAEKGAYANGPIQKLERGVGNAAFGWTELPKRIVDQTKLHGPIKGVVLGTFQGVCRTFARTVSGAADIVSFPIAGYDEPAVIADMPKAE